MNTHKYCAGCATLNCIVSSLKIRDYITPTSCMAKLSENCVCRNCIVKVVCKHKLSCREFVNYIIKYKHNNLPNIRELKVFLLQFNNLKAVESIVDYVRTKNESYPEE